MHDVQEELILSIKEADLAELTTGIQQLASSQQLPDKRLMDALSDRLASHFGDPEADAGSLLAAFWGLAALGYQPSSAFLREVSDAMIVRLSDCSAQDISRSAADQQDFCPPSSIVYFPVIANLQCPRLCTV